MEYIKGVLTSKATLYPLIVVLTLGTIILVVALLNKMKKNKASADTKKEETEEAPEMMAAEVAPVQGPVDLMASAPAPEPVEPEIPQRKNEFEEAPGFDMSESANKALELPVEKETSTPAPMPFVDPASMPVQPQMPNAMPQMPTSAFDMPMPAANVQTINGTNPEVKPEPVVVPAFEASPAAEPVIPESPVIEPSSVIEAVPVIEEVPVVPKPAEPVTEQMEEVEELDSLNSLEDDIKEATVQLPKMVNAEINDNITVTKKCPFCGYENEYSAKTCIKCGNEI